MKCTWVDCLKDASVPQIAKDGEVWADLCVEHDQRLIAAIDSGDPKQLLGLWVKAGGGHKKMAARMVGER